MIVYETGEPRVTLCRVCSSSHWWFFDAALAIEWNSYEVSRARDSCPEHRRCTCAMPIMSRMNEVEAYYLAPACLNSTALPDDTANKRCILQLHMNAPRKTPAHRVATYIDIKWSLQRRLLQ